MVSAAIRALLFSTTGLAVIATFEIVTFELPPAGGSLHWEQKLALHFGLAVVFALVAFVGSLGGFAVGYRVRLVSFRVASILGVGFLLAALAVVLPVAASGLLILSMILGLILAFTIAWAGSVFFGKSQARLEDER